METSPGWAALVLDLPEGVEDELAGSLGGESLGTEAVPALPGRIRLRVFVPSLDEAASLLAGTPERLSASGLPSGSWTACIEPVEDLRWVERYQAGLHPFPLGDRYLVVPNGRPHEEPGRISILLVPGRAFGTGQHPTTRLCAEALERWVCPGSSWLDLGCGSGILSLVALHRGAAQVLARDDDPEAVEVASEVLAANRATGRVDLALGSAEGLADRQLDGVVANIAAPYFLARAPAAVAPLRRGGILIAAGLLVDELDDLARTLAAAGAPTIERCDSEGWGLLVARREPRS